MKTKIEMFLDYVDSPESRTNELCRKDILPKFKRKSRVYQAMKAAQRDMAKTITR